MRPLIQSTRVPLNVKLNTPSGLMMIMKLKFKLPLSKKELSLSNIWFTVLLSLKSRFVMTRSSKSLEIPHPRDKLFSSPLSLPSLNSLPSLTTRTL